MQESRLFQIVYHLLEKGRATAPELAEKLEVSVRTIYRDIDALSSAGIPVYAEPGRNGGIRLMSGFVLDRAVLSEEEKREIFTALQSVNTARRKENSEILHKLSALWGDCSEDWLEVNFSRWGSGQSDNEKFESLKSAVIHRRSVKITYAGSNGKTGVRVVFPLRLLYQSAAWYLKAYCTQKRGYRIFKLARILEWEVLQERFSGQYVFPGEEPAPERTYSRIVLRFPKEMAYRVYDEFDAAQVEREENGDFVVCARMPEDAWLTGFLLSFGTRVEVIEPAYLREVLAEQGRMIEEKNKP